ncbi:MAG: protein-L-isoaspartate O-methyltransferase, partial [Bryobacteraceae bacterium]
LMTERLELTGGETALEIGAGSGYHAAVLSSIAARVIAIELIPELAAEARANLERTAYLNNVTVVCGDGSTGWPEAAPYGAISVAAGAREIPWQLLDQLDDPGRLVIPVGSREDQDLKVISKIDGTVSTRAAGFCRFVPLRGEQGWR